MIKGTKHIDGLVQDCSNSIANALELLQSCTKPSIHASRFPQWTHHSADGPPVIWPCLALSPLGKSSHTICVIRLTSYQRQPIGPGRLDRILKRVFFKLISRIDIMNASSKIVMRNPPVIGHPPHKCPRKLVSPNFVVVWILQIFLKVTQRQRSAN